jgi:putative hydrolase of the HAD superfamily
VEAALRDLRSRGIRLGVVCDSGLMVGRVLRERLRRAGLSDYFEPGAMAFSDEVGVTKPRPEMFRAALDVIGVPPAEAAHIGDLKATDVAGARALGMRSVRFKGFNDDMDEGPEADAVIDNYDQLPEALGLE